MMSMERNRVEVSAGFLLLAAWLNYWDRQGVFPQVLLACVLHELGHLLALRWLGVPVEKLRVTAVGAEIRIAGSLSYRGELAAALAGPAVNLVLAGWLSGMPGGAVGAGVNLVLGLFNLLPVGRLDGGRVLSCVLVLLFGPEFGERVSWLISWLCVVLLSAAGIWVLWLGGNGSLLMVSLWLAISMSEFGGKRGK